MKIKSYKEWRMVHPASYSKACKLGIQHKVAKLMGWNEPSYNPKHKKQELLKIAQRGENKPSIASHRLGHSLHAYVNHSNRSYDPDFTRQIKKLRPDWLISKSDTANKKKQELLKIATSGKNRPIARSWLGRGLIKYTLKSQNSYDPVFHKQIKKLRPDWFK
jgi:hypothetical protein